MPRLISGIQPSGNITLGNYIGALQNFVKLQDELPDHEILIFVADLHAITVPQDRAVLRKNIRSLVALYLACGLRRDRVHIFIQSEVPCHNQLGWVMECTGYVSEFERMTQYKDKKQKQIAGVKGGLLTYPALMAADILLYDADCVPVGEDQKQHLEITRNLAERFNTTNGDTFVVPEPLISKIGAKIMSLQEPDRKMSKSDPNPKGYISLLDDLAVVKNKIKSAVTDLDGKVKFDEKEKPGISNLLTIYSVLSNMSIPSIEEKYVGCGYAVFKEDLAKIVCDYLKPIQEKYKEYLDGTELDEILDEGREYATHLAIRKMGKVYNKLGLGRKK